MPGVRICQDYQHLGAPERVNRHGRNSNGHVYLGTVRLSYETECALYHSIGVVDGLEYQAFLSFHREWSKYRS